MSAKKAPQSNIKERPPVIAVMGHIDHGKSSLLDYIRQSKVVDSEAGGITQHISAYEVEHEHNGATKKITFLDTPGHEAFQKMRQRGGQAADIAILVVSAEDGVKPQTLEALAAIKSSNTPYIVAINKIDTPKADVEKTKGNLLENEIYLEGLGGDVPFVPISAKTGEGIPDLLDMMLLVAELQELTADAAKPAEGIVIESHRDPKKGVSATLIIRNGTMKSGNFVVAGGAFAPLRIIEDFTGKKLKEATVSSPVTVIGFNDVPEVGSDFCMVGTKKEAEAAACAPDVAGANGAAVIGNEKDAHIIIPIIIKSDVQGSIEAIEHELHKLENERIALKIVTSGVGAVSEGDVKTASSSDHAVIVGFHVGVDAAARDLAERLNVSIGTFDIIYELAEWLDEAIKKRTPKMMVSERTGLSKVKRIFSQTKDKQVLGGKVTEGAIALKSTVAILRRGEKIGEGIVTSLQQSKAVAERVEEDNEFGAQVESKTEIVGGDELESFILVEK